MPVRHVVGVGSFVYQEAQINQHVITNKDTQTSWLLAGSHPCMLIGGWRFSGEVTAATVTAR